MLSSYAIQMIDRLCARVLCCKPILSIRGPQARYCSRRCTSAANNLAHRQAYPCIQFQRIARAWFTAPAAIVPNVARTLDVTNFSKR